MGRHNLDPQHEEQALEEVKCDECQGHGFVVVRYDDTHRDEFDCGACNGRGTLLL